MASELCHSNHWRVLPKSELVLSEPMWAEKLSLILVPQQSANLRASVNWVDACTGVRVPELYAAVTTSSTRSQQVALEGAPSEGFHRWCVVLKPVKPLRRWVWRSHWSVPYMEKVIIPSTRQLLARGWPFEPANLLLMPSVGLNNVRSNSYVVVDDLTVHSTSSKYVIVPGQWAYSQSVATSESS